MDSQEQKEEGIRLKIFIQRICKMSQEDFSAEVEYSPYQVSKCVHGTQQVPAPMLRAMHRKWQLNYNWFYTGTGSLTTSKLDEKKLMNNVGEILASVAFIEKTVDTMRIDLKKLAGEVYAMKHKV